MALLTRTPKASEDYPYWQDHDKKKCGRVNLLINAPLRTTFEG